MLKIIDIQKHGSADKEYVLLQASEKGSTAGFLIVDATYREGSLSNVYRHNYFFEEYPFEEGEYIALWTGKRSDGKEYVKGKMKDGTPLHNFYWGSGAPIWNDAEDDAAHLLRYSIIDRYKKDS